MNNIVSLGIHADEVSIEAIERYKYFDGAKEVLVSEMNIRVSRDILNYHILDIISETLEDARTNAYQMRSACVTGLYKGDRVYAEIWSTKTHQFHLEEEDSNEIAREYSIYVYGNRHVIRYIMGILDARFAKSRLAKIEWWHRSDRGPSTRSLYLPPLTTRLHPEFYPGMSDPSSYLKEYLKSDASVLMLAGPPGTGKTTLLRHLICENKLSAHVVYDETLMSDDKVFQGFLFGDGDIMIIEDADALITSREYEKNLLMSRFLNLADGLIKLPNKKLVFTTNISDFNKVDSALVRPGRCFGVVHTRPLNLSEAQAAAKVANLPIPVEKGEYTLAELFNGVSKHQTRTIGFVN